MTTMLASCSQKEMATSLSIECVPKFVQTYTHGDTLVGPNGEMRDGSTHGQEIHIENNGKRYIYNWFVPPCELALNQKYIFILAAEHKSVQHIQDLERNTIWKQDIKKPKARVSLIRIEDIAVEQ